MNKALVCGLTAALLVTGACSSASTPPAATATPTPPPATAAATQPTAPAADTAGAQDFTLVNATGVEIDKVFISPHDSDDWEEDILGQDTLPDGQKVDVKFNRAEKSALWDLRVEDSKENSIEWENLNLLEISKLTLNYKDGKATALAE
ncbi:MAG TPA: hypothetical protein VNO50_04890 [Pyrinomonadaceae bacterium]|nr:hypothetical protein [Pyrinomonadaceae bacterium]